MSVTDLTGTTWILNNNIDSSFSEIDVYINFISNNQNFTRFEYYNEDNGYLFYWNGTNGFDIFDNGEWLVSEPYKTINIINGTDTNNSDLISFLELCATQILPQPIRPDFYKVTDLELTSIADAIRSKASISESLTFPDEFINGIENAGGYCNISIGDYYNRTYTSIEAGVSEIGPGTFYEHSSLTTASFPNCITIGTSAFRNCSSLTTISFPNCISIDSYAFTFCYSLTTLSFPNCVFIDRQAFAQCFALTSIFFPSCNYIGYAAFGECDSLTTAFFPNCASINTFAFQSCPKLTNISFPNCTSIGNSAFRNCSSLTNASFPNCISIGNAAFQSCSILTNVSFPNCTSIGGYAFVGCYSLTAVSFPKCTLIDFAAFSQCLNLISLNFTGISSVPSLTNSNAFLSTPIGGYSVSAGQYGSIYVPSSLLTSFQTTTNWTYFSDRMVGV